VEYAAPPFDHVEATLVMLDYWFFGFDKRLEGYGERTGRRVGPETVEPVVLKIYEMAKTLNPDRFMTAIDWMNKARRRLGAFFADYDVLLTPTCAAPAPRHGLYGLNIENMEAAEYLVYADGPVQFCFMYNVMGAPAISLPLAMHSSGLPIGIQFGARPQHDEVLIEIGALLEELMPWKDRAAPLGIA
jgi:amidase